MNKGQRPGCRAPFFRSVYRWSDFLRPEGFASGALPSSSSICTASCHRASHQVFDASRYLFYPQDIWEHCGIPAVSPCEHNHWDVVCLTFNNSDILYFRATCMYSEISRRVSYCFFASARFPSMEELLPVSKCISISARIRYQMSWCMYEMSTKPFKVDQSHFIFGAITNGGKRGDRLVPIIEQDLLQTLLLLMVEFQRLLA